ncbi:hypothetical protein [Dysgonomonas massiliensis]|uniref:hypothetical protein n=1 Tax=Dysgonomonas massiliensis TaxID=2040292 RepID=UPI000C780633|nr:hypothetical protein [Dysgonomonas massiliensis]
MERQIISQGDNLPPKKKVINKVFVLIDKVLYSFKPFSKKEDGSTSISENDITQDLERLLNDKSESELLPFRFQNQSKEVGKRSTSDMGIYLKGTTDPYFMWIEAKRLPTPEAGNRRDEREYVVVDKKYAGGGGISRFKMGEHASRLTNSIIIGYIQDFTFEYWFHKVNTWIKELSINEQNWEENDCIIEYGKGLCKQYQSSHRRPNGTNIELRHFWVEV